MDTQAVNNARNSTAQKLKSTNPSSPATDKSSSAPTEDIVSLSQDAQTRVQRNKASSSKITTTNIDQRKISVTDNNDIVFEVIDSQTQKVIRTVPSEEQLKLRDAIQDELEKM
jgi:uncharacterized FlaG/YvyC family protein